jgi:hypothetical protein
MEQHKKVHGQQAESGECDFVLRLIVEWLADATSVLLVGTSAVGSYLAFEQVSDLLLHALSLSQKTLVDAQPLESPLSVAHIVHLGCAVFDGAPQ